MLAKIPDNFYLEKQQLYENGLPFDGKLDVNIDDIIHRVEGRKAAMVIIDGPSGEGKTTLACHILNYINIQHGKLPLVIDGPQLAMGGLEFLKKFDTCATHKLPGAAYDEGGDFSKRGSLTQFNAMMIRHFETYRSASVIVLVILPNFLVLDNQLFDLEIPRMLLHCRDRNMKYGNYKAYSLYRMNLIRQKFIKWKNKQVAFMGVDPNFYGHFYDLDPENSKKLDIVCAKSKKSFRQKAMIKMEGLLSYPELATKLFKSLRWVRQATSVLKIKPTRTVGRAAYFSQESLGILTQHMESIQEKTDERKPRGRDR